MTIYYNSDNAGERTISESIQQDFKQVGIKLDIRGEEKQAFLDRQKQESLILCTLYRGTSL